MQQRDVTEKNMNHLVVSTNNKYIFNTHTKTNEAAKCYLKGRISTEPQLPIT